MSRITYSEFIEALEPLQRAGRRQITLAYRGLKGQGLVELEQISPSVLPPEQHKIIEQYLMKTFVDPGYANSEGGSEGTLRLELATMTVTERHLERRITMGRYQFTDRGDLKSLPDPVPADVMRR